MESRRDGQIVVWAYLANHKVADAHALRTAA